MVRQAPRAEQHQPPGAVGRGRRGLRSLRLGEVDPHPDDQRSRADQRGEAVRRRDGPLRQEDRHQQAAGGDRIRLPAVQPLPHLSVLKNITLAPIKIRNKSGRRPRRRPWRSSNASAWRRSGTPTRPSFPEAAAAGRHRPGLRWTRRSCSSTSPLGARPRDDRRGAPGHEGSGPLRHDDDGGHP